MTNTASLNATRHSHCDAVVIGAGFGGLYAVHKLRDQMGLDVRAFDNASDVGGTWFWNRYPGALSDTESFCYRYSFDKELLAKGKWKTRYLTQPEILDYLNDFADNFDLRKTFTFNTRIESATFDESTNRWTVTSDTNETVSCRYLVTGLGLLSSINKPNFAGIETFGGQIVHTGAWSQNLDLKGKRVAVIGTGSTGVQVIIAIAPEVEHLTVFQRSAQYVVPIGNWPEDTETIKGYKERYDTIWEQIKGSQVAMGFEESPVAGASLTEPQRKRVFEEAWKRGGGFRFMFETFSDVATNASVNKSACDFIKSKIAHIVDDAETAQKLMPNDLYAKRPLCATDYYGVFNRDNVTLVDVKQDPISSFTETGVRLSSGEEHSLDAVIFATGFDAVDGNYTKIDIRGRGGVAMTEVWRDGPLGYLGMMEAGFPNFFMILGPNGPFTNLPPSIETQVEWISDAIGYLERNGHSTIEPKVEARDQWVDTCRSIADQTLFPKAQSWIFGANIPGKKNAVMFFLGGLGEYRKKALAVQANGYDELNIS